MLGVWALCPRPAAALLTLCLARAPSNAASNAAPFSRQCQRPRPLTAPWRSRPAQPSCVTPAEMCARARCCGSRTSTSTSSALSAKVSERLWPVPWLQWPQGQPGLQPRFRAHRVSPGSGVFGSRQSPESSHNSVIVSVWPASLMGVIEESGRVGRVRTGARSPGVSLYSCTQRPRIQVQWPQQGGYLGPRARGHMVLVGSMTHQCGGTDCPGPHGNPHWRRERTLLCVPNENGLNFL